MRLGPSLVAIGTCLGLAACGGSSHSSTTTATSTPPAPPTVVTTVRATTPASAAATTTTTAATTTTTAATTTTTATASAPPEVPETKTHKHPGEDGGHGGASQGARVETSVTIATNGDVSPPVLSVPSGVGIEIHVRNHGSVPETVELSVPARPSVHLAPFASGKLESAGLKNGTYRILVNGTPRGQLLSGAQGGP
jgi:hypothetical protein